MATAQRLDALFLSLPSPPLREVLREYAGGFGVALPSARTTVGHGPIKQPYLALAYAATIARGAGMRVEVLDAQAESLDVAGLVSRVEAAKPEVIVSPLGLPSLSFDLNLLASLKARTGATTIGIGTVCRVPELLDDVLAEGGVDVAVTGDLEPIVIRLLHEATSGHRLSEVKGCAVRTPAGIVDSGGVDLEDLGQLPIPAFDMLPMHRYLTWEWGRTGHALGRQFGPWPRFFPLYASRGCPHGCSYCPYPLGWGRKWRHKSVEHFVGEITTLVATGTSHILLRDQTVSENLEFLEGLCQRLIRARLDVRWLCEARPGSLSPKMLGLMHDAGCTRIHYGVETGDPALFSDTAKRGIQADSVDQCIQDTSDAGITPSLHFLVGFDHDSWKTVAATIDLIDRLHISNGDCSIMTPYPGTRHYQKMRAEGRILATSWEEFTGTDPIASIPGLSPVELATARWRILSAIEANRRRGMRARLSQAGHALVQTRSTVDPAPLIDAAIGVSGESSSISAEAVATQGSTT